MTDRPRWLEALHRLFGIDIRALAAFRIGIAVMLLADLYMRFNTLTVFHTDWGILPRHALQEDTRAWMLSLYMIDGNAPLAAFLLGLTVVFAVMLLVGYKTRLATVLCVVMLMSVQRRNPIVVNSGDLLLYFLLFWSMFLPLGACASVDSRGRGAQDPTPPKRICNVATLAILLQLLYIYVFSALLKNHTIWKEDYSAVYYAVNIDRLVAHLGLWFREHYELTKAITVATWYFELIGPFLAFVPFGFKYLRPLTAFLFMGFHIGLAVSFKLVLFPYICVVAWMLYLPTEFWDGIANLKLVDAAKRGWSGVLCAAAFGIRRVTRGARFFAPKPCSWRLELPERVVVILLVVYVFFWNLGGVNHKFQVPASLSPLSSVLWIKQHWGMFAPYPMRDDGWMVVPARLVDGTEVDLRTGEPPTFEKPHYMSMTYDSPRWRKFAESIWRGEHRSKVIYWGNWLRRRWDQQHDRTKQVEAMQVYHVVEFTRPYPVPPYVSTPQLMYEWEGPGSDHWVKFEQNQANYMTDMKKDNDRRAEADQAQADDIQDPSTPSP